MPAMIPREMEPALIIAVLTTLYRHGRSRADVLQYFRGFHPEASLDLEQVARQFCLPVHSFVEEIAREMSARTGQLCRVDDEGDQREVLQ
jgi:hypothetical protein